MRGARKRLAALAFVFYFLVIFVAVFCLVTFWSSPYTDKHVVEVGDRTVSVLQTLCIFAIVFGVLGVDSAKKNLRQEGINFFEILALLVTALLLFIGTGLTLRYVWF